MGRFPSRRAGALALVVLAVVVSGCRGRDATPGTGPVRFFVLAAEAPVFDGPGGTEVAKLRFGGEIHGGEAIRGWIRWAEGGSPRFVARNLVESEAQRLVRQSETKKILALTPHAAILVRDAAISWGSGFDSPSLGTLRKGTRVKVYTAEGDFRAIELASPGGGSDRFVGYVPMDAIAWEKGEKPEGGAAPTRLAKVRVVEHEPAAEAGIRGGGIVPEPEGIPGAPVPPRSAPEAIEKMPAIFPAAARRAGVSGVVRLEAEVLEDGSTGDVKVLASVRDDVDEAAVRAVKGWRWRPAEVEGRPARATAIVEVRFDPE